MGRQLERIWALTGVLFVLLFAAGLLFGDLLGSRNYPPVDAAPSTVREYFVLNSVQVRALSFFHVLAALALLCFTAYLATAVSRIGRPGCSVLTVAGGTSAGTFLLLSALCYRALAEPAVANDAPLAHALLVLSYLAGGPALVPLALPIGCGMALALRRLLLPRWTGWLGLAAVLALLGTSTWLLGPLDNRSAVYAIVLLAAGLDFLWLFAASALLAVRPVEAPSRPSFSRTRARS